MLVLAFGLAPTQALADSSCRSLYGERVRCTGLAATVRAEADRVSPRALRVEVRSPRTIRMFVDTCISTGTELDGCSDGKYVMVRPGRTRFRAVNLQEEFVGPPPGWKYGDPLRGFFKTVPWRADVAFLHFDKLDIEVRPDDGRITAVQLSR